MNPKALTILSKTMPMAAAMLLGCLLVWIAPASASTKLSELEQKIADLSLLQEQLAHRIEQIQSIRGGLIDQRNMLTSEIRLLVKNLQIDTLQKAREHLRLKYNIELLRTTWTYIDELEAKVLFYQNGLERLAYLSRMAEDDIRMLSALNDLKIDALTTQISLIINRYLPEAHAIQIDPQRVVFITNEQVWERVIKEK